MLRLSWQQVRAYRLSEHHLDRRPPKRELARVVADICGVQAQLLSAAELAIWARVDGVKKGDLQDSLWKDKTLVKTWGMRGTIHLLTSAEFSTYVTVLEKTRTGYRKGAWLRYFRVTIDEVDRIIELIGSALGQEGLTRGELADLVSNEIGSHLRKSMLSGWGEFLKPAAYKGKLIFGPPRDGKTTFLRPDRWLKTNAKGDNFDESVRRILRQYLRAYGPANPADFARWWGIDAAPARRLFDLVEDEITQVDVEGYTASVLSKDIDKIRKISHVNSVRLLPSFDSYVLGFRPREILVPKKYLPMVFRQQAWISPVLLVNGKVEGIWEIPRKTPTKLIVKLFTRLSAIKKGELTREVNRLGEFLERKLSLSFIQCEA